MTTADDGFDLIVWGATGFTGRLVTEYLLERQPPGGTLRWAAGGRNRAKLKALLAALGTSEKSIPIVIADGTDAAAMQQLVSRTRVVLSTVGPYARYGTPLVAACAAGGTHYCDLCGEPQWMRSMIDAYQSAAAASGARIVHSCGFDSIPSDFGVWFLQREAMARFGAPCRQIRLLIKATRGGVSGGTVASLSESMDAARADRRVARILVDPYALNPPGERDGPDRRDQTGVVRDDVADTWTAPFVMAVINTKVVRRSNALLGYPWGRDFRYSEAVMTGSGPVGWSKAMAISSGLAAFMLANSFRPTRSLFVRPLLPKPGEGPSEQTRQRGFFSLVLYGTLPDGTVLEAKVRGDRDPGYGSTSKMLAESATCLALDGVSTGGGFWTPTSAMGEALFRRLVDYAGLSFELTNIRSR